MSDKAKVTICVGMSFKDYELAPGDTLRLESQGVTAITLKPAKGPQPEAVWKGWRYRFDATDTAYRFTESNSLNGWRTVAFGNVPDLPPAYLRFLADLKERTEKWAAE